MDDCILKINVKADCLHQLVLPQEPQCPEWFYRGKLQQMNNQYHGGLLILLMGQCIFAEMGREGWGGRLPYCLFEAIIRRQK